MVSLFWLTRIRELKFASQRNPTAARREFSLCSTAEVAATLLVDLVGAGLHLVVNIVLLWFWYLLPFIGTIVWISYPMLLQQIIDKVLIRKPTV